MDGSSDYWEISRYSFGVVAQYFNIAAQTCIWTFTLHYVTDALGVSDKVAGYWLQASLLVFLVFRFSWSGSWDDSMPASS